MASAFGIDRAEQVRNQITSISGLEASMWPRVHDTLGGRVGWYNASRWLHTNHGGSHARSHYAQGSS
jgi:hypothetical protein